MPGKSVSDTLRTPPYDEEAERGLLGCAIQNPDVVIDLALERGIKTSSFYLKAHQHVWDALTDMQSMNKLIDGVMLNNRLKDKQLLEEVGGILYLQRIMDAAPISVHAESYLEVVREKALIRSILSCAREAVDRCYDPDLELDLLVD